MSRNYTSKYRKGKFNTGSIKAKKADYSKTAWKNLTENEAKWKSDTRKYDYPYRDTGPDFYYHKESPSAAEAFRKKAFKYKARSKKKLGKKTGRQNKHYRRYWY